MSNLRTDFRARFPRRNTFFTVVECEGVRQTCRNVGISQEEGADGAFLINHQISPKALLECYGAARKVCPNFWLGVNLLSLSPWRAAETISEIGYRPEGLWVDDGGIRENEKPPDAQAKIFAFVWRQTRWRGLLFGGVAFKGQTPVVDAARLAALAAPHMDVVTTSGPQTEKPPSLEKIAAMRGAIGGHPLAIASGMTPENVGPYLGHNVCLMIATGISKSANELDPSRVRLMARLVQAAG